MDKYELFVREILQKADIVVGGSRPFDLQVNNPRFYKKVVTQTQLGLGESYMDGWWECDAIDEFICRLIGSGADKQLKLSLSLAWLMIKAKLSNLQNVKISLKNASHHYDIGNDMYEKMLDKRMIYSCAYWKDAKDLDQAQEAKLELICKKLKLEKGMTLLDIGCGWGGFIEYASKNYGVKVTGISPAIEQVKVAKRRIKSRNGKVLQKDYRQIKGKYDRIVSIGMLEHVGVKNYETFFRHCSRLLKDDGLMLHHTIGGNRSVKTVDAWTNKYIFPGGVVPSLKQISASIEDYLIIEDLHNFGPDYDKTLMAWHKNFNKNFQTLSPKYDARFKRMWNYYLLISAGGFRSRHLQLWQIVMRKSLPTPTYESVR